MSLHGGTLMDSRQAARAVIFERRLLIVCIWMAVLSLLTWIVAISTEYWYVSRCNGTSVVVETGIPGRSRAALLSGHAGLWRTCKTVMSNGTCEAVLSSGNQTSKKVCVTTACRNHEMSSNPQQPSDHPVNVLSGYWRTSVAFSVLSVLMQLLTIFFSWYSIRVPRYTFKRLTGCLYFISAAVKLVVIQLQDTAVNLQTTLAHWLIAPGHCTLNYSFSFIMAFVCFIVNIVCALCVFYTSGKKKKKGHIHSVLGHDYSGDEDEPVILSGR